MLPRLCSRLSISPCSRETSSACARRSASTRLLAAARSLSLIKPTTGMPKVNTRVAPERAMPSATSTRNSSPSATGARHGSYAADVPRPGAQAQVRAEPVVQNRLHRLVRCRRAPFATTERSLYAPNHAMLAFKWAAAATKIAARPPATGFREQASSAPPLGRTRRSSRAASRTAARVRSEQKPSRTCRGCNRSARRPAGPAPVAATLGSLTVIPAG